MAKQEKHQGIANPAYALAMVELRRSGASGTHADKRTRRARTRSASLRRAIDEAKE
jgi:hypothetical protein